MVSKIDVAWDLFLEGKTSEAKKLVEQDFSIDTCTAVSYTHLDVYKRQVSHSLLKFHHVLLVRLVTNKLITW